MRKRGVLSVARYSKPVVLEAPKASHSGWKFERLGLINRILNLPSVLNIRWRELRLPLRWLLAGLVIRLSIAPFTYARDFFFFVGAAYYTSMNLQALFTLQYWVYPPPQLWVIVALYRFWSILPISHNLLIKGMVSQLDHGFIPAGVHDFLVNPVLVLLFKLPSITADILSGIIILQALRAFNVGEQRARLGFKVWMLNPVVIWISSASGHFDAIPTLFALYALVSMVRQRTSRAAISLGIGGAWKLWPLLLLPVFIALQRDGKALIGNLRKLSLSILLALTPVACISLVYLFYPGTGVLKQFGPFTSPVGFGVILGYIIPVEPLGSWLGGIPLTFTVFVTFLLVLFRSETKNSIEVANGLVLADILLFLSLSPIGAQYVIWALPFLTIDLIIYRTHTWFFFGITGIMLTQLVIALDVIGFGFYFATIIPTYAYDWLDSLLYTSTIVGVLRGTFVALSLYYLVLNLAPLVVARVRSDSVFSGANRS